MEEPIVEKSEKITVYTWKYDNGARGYAVKQKNKGWLKQKSYATKREVEECCREYKEQSAHQTVKKKKVGFSAGLRYVKDRYGAKKKDGRDKNGIEAMLALLNSCGTTPDAKREMLCLVAAVLAGYCARVSTRSYMRFLSQLQRRAPIIVVKQAPFAGEVLEYIAVLIGGNTFRWKLIERDEELITMLIELESAFWNYVQERTAPPLDGSDASVRFLAERFPNSVPRSEIILPDTATGLLAQYDEACEQLEAITEKKQQAENLLKQMMGEHEVGTTGSRIITWKSVSQERLDSKTLKAEHPALYQKYTNKTSYRRFSIKAAV